MANLMNISETFAELVERYDALMETYNQLLLRKAEAIAVAVERGLRQRFQEA